MVNIDEYEKFIIQYEKLIYNIAYKMFLNQEDAKDVSQEVCIKIYNNFDRLKKISNIKAFVYTMTYNTCMDEFRKRKGKTTIDLQELPETADSEKNPEEKFIENEKNNNIYKAMNDLSQEHRAYIILRDIEGLSYSEVSAVMGINIGTVKSGINRARNNLKKIIVKKGKENFF